MHSLLPEDLTIPEGWAIPEGSAIPKGSAIVTNHLLLNWVLDFSMEIWRGHRHSHNNILSTVYTQGSSLLRAF